jgi:predicted nicotinamide N-methyase
MTAVADRCRFILEHTEFLPVPLVPEVSLYLAHEAVPLWQKTEEELGSIGLPPPFWAFAWAGGQALARYVLDNSQTVHGNRVLDLASGSGLVAVAAMMAGASEVLAADIDVFAIQAIGMNVAANNVQVSVANEDLLDAAPPAMDVILVGDLFYEKTLAGKLLGWLVQARKNGSVVLIGDPGRSYLPRDKLVSCAAYEVPVTRDLEDAEIKHTQVWRLA